MLQPGERTLCIIVRFSFFPSETRSPVIQGGHELAVLVVHDLEFLFFLLPVNGLCFIIMSSFPWVLGIMSNILGVVITKSLFYSITRITNKKLKFNHNGCGQLALPLFLN